MTEDQKLEVKEFEELIEMYRDHVGDERNRRTRKISVFWSFISIFYVHSDLHLNITEIAEGTRGIVTPWGIPITGVTEEKFLHFLFIMVLYFIIKFVFSMIKINKDTNIVNIFMHFLSVDDFSVGLQTGDGSRKEIIQQFKMARLSEDDPDNNYIERRRYTWLFIYRYRIIGFLDYFFTPILFPAILGFWALIVLAIRVWF